MPDRPGWSTWQAPTDGAGTAADQTFECSYGSWLCFVGQNLSLMTMMMLGLVGSDNQRPLRLRICWLLYYWCHLSRPAVPSMGQSVRRSAGYALACYSMAILATVVPNRDCAAC